jgi:hypothetical protein
VSASKSSLVRKEDFARRIGCGLTKFWELQKAGVIPPPTHLPMLDGRPGRICYWPEDIVEEVLRRIAAPCRAASPYLNDPFGRSEVR